MSTSTHSDEALAALLDQVVASTGSATAGIDETVAYVEASNRRIAAMEDAALRQRIARLAMHGEPRQLSEE